MGSECWNPQIVSHTWWNCIRLMQFTSSASLPMTKRIVEYLDFSDSGNQSLNHRSGTLNVSKLFLLFLHATSSFMLLHIFFLNCHSIQFLMLHQCKRVSYSLFPPLYKLNSICPSFLATLSVTLTLIIEESKNQVWPVK